METPARAKMLLFLTPNKCPTAPLIFRMCWPIFLRVAGGHWGTRCAEMSWRREGRTQVSESWGSEQAGARPSHGTRDRTNRSHAGHWAGDTPTPLVPSDTIRYHQELQLIAQCSECGVSAVTATAAWHHAPSPVGQSRSPSVKILLTIFI